MAAEQSLPGIGKHVDFTQRLFGVVLTGGFHFVVEVTATDVAEADGDFVVEAPIAVGAENHRDGDCGQWWCANGADPGLVAPLAERLLYRFGELRVAALDSPDFADLAVGLYPQLRPNLAGVAGLDQLGGKNRCRRVHRHQK